MHLLMQVALEWYGRGFVEKAWLEYTESSLQPFTMEEAHEAETSFVPWAVFNYIPQEESDGEPPNEVPLAFEVLLVADDLDPYEKEFLLEACRQPVTFWSVQEVDSGSSLKLRDLFTHTEHMVRERQASTVLRKGDIVYTRVISLGQTAIMCGMAPIFFSPDFHFDILNAKETLFGSRRKISIRDLQEVEPILRELYFGLRRRRLNPQMPILQNTDGDPLEFVKLTYRLNCSTKAAFEKLRSLNPLEAEEVLLADATYDESQELQTVEFSWLKKGNEKHRSWDNTILGNIAIEDGKLIIDVNSQKRCEMIQSEIAERLGDDAILQDRVNESFAEKIAQFKDGEGAEELQREREEQATLSAMPEVQALMKEMAKQHWEDWLNEPVPALRGKTPRQAAKTSTGRERLEALLVDFESRAVDMDNDAFAPDVTALRTELGMLPGSGNHKVSRKRKMSGPRKEGQERNAVPLYQLKIALTGSNPPVWRRVVVRSDMSLDRLHNVIQEVMGWTDSHLHQFVVGNTYYGIPDPDMRGFGRDTLNEKRYTVAQLAPAVKSKFVYEYDFGDDWLHKVVLEKILPPDPEFQHPACLAGKNACPPEDCGGIPGYYNLLEVLADPGDPEHESMKDWLGYDFDPTQFDLEYANDVLSRLKA